MKYTFWHTTAGKYPMRKDSREMELSEALRVMADLVDSPSEAGEFHIRNDTDSSVLEMTVERSEIWTTLDNGARVLGYKFIVTPWDPELSMICPGPHG